MAVSVRPPSLNIFVFCCAIWGSQQPNEVTFGSMLDACARAGQMERAEKWLERMSEAAVQLGLNLCFSNGGVQCINDPAIVSFKWFKWLLNPIAVGGFSNLISGVTRFVWFHYQCVSRLGTVIVQGSRANTATQVWLMEQRRKVTWHLLPLGWISGRDVQWCVLCFQDCYIRLV